MSATATAATRVRPTSWPARSADWVALTGTVAGLAEWLGAPADFLRALVLVAAYAEPWVIAAYVVVAVALAAPGERRPGAGGLVAAGKVAALVVLFSGPALLPGMSTMFERDPSSWIPYGAIVVTGLAALLVRDRAEGASRSPRETVLAAAPFVLCAAGFALAVVLLPDVRWERWLFVPTVIAGAALIARPRAALVRAAIAPAVVLASLSILQMGAGVGLEGGVGDTTVRPRTAAALPAELRRAVGDVDLDLAGLRGPPRLAVDAAVGVGTIDVTVPPRTLVEIDARVGRGSVSVENRSRAPPCCASSS